MKTSRLGRHALSSCAAVALLVGCGVLPFDLAQGRLAQDDMQPSIGVPIYGARSTNGGAQASSSSGGAYLYVTDFDSTVTILTYPQGTYVSQIEQTGYLCVDPDTGYLYISEAGLSEYPPGSNELEQRATLPHGYSTGGCAVDPTTGNIAVIVHDPFSTQKLSVGRGDKNGYDYIYVYPGIGGTPQVYARAKNQPYVFCGFDNDGNLFVDGEERGHNGIVFWELPAGSDRIKRIKLSKPIINTPGTVQWDGKFITLEQRYNPAIYRISVSGPRGKVESVVRLDHVGGGGPGRSHMPQSFTWIQGTTVVASHGHGLQGIAFWRYPAGGKPHEKLKLPGKDAITVTVAVSMPKNMDHFTAVRATKKPASLRGLVWSSAQLTSGAFESRWIRPGSAIATWVLR